MNEIKHGESSPKNVGHRWQTGECPNPKGRPAAPEIAELRMALDKAKKENKRSFLEHFVNRAFRDDTVAIALARKLLPDKMAAELQGDLIQYIIDYKNANHTNTG